MDSSFPRILSLLRKEKGISQKNAAKELGVSQSLLSHYEKGIRECGLLFVLKAAEYYDVSCDYLLGKSPEKKGTTISIEDLKEEQSEEKNGKSRTFKVLYKKKILFCSLNILIDFLTKTKNSKLVEEIFSFLYLAVYRMFRIIFKINKNNNNQMFSIDDLSSNQLASASMLKSEANANCSASNEFKNKEENLENLLINSRTLEKQYPQNYNALLNLIKTCETTINS